MTFTQIKTEILRLTKTDTASYPIDEITESVNRAYDRIVTMIRKSEGRWQWDDSNNTDFPFAYTDITANIGDYTEDESHYIIQDVEILSPGATQFSKLIPFDIKDARCASYTTLRQTTGIPVMYDKIGNSIILAPMPNYTQAASLRCYYERGPNYFISSDTAKSPGFNPLFHRLLSYYAAYDYAFINSLPLANQLMIQNGAIVGAIPKIENDLMDSYSKRDKDEHVKLSVRKYGSWR